MQRIFLFTELGDRSPARRALSDADAIVTSRALHGTYLDCPIALPPDLVVIEPAPLRALDALQPMLAVHPVLARVPWLLVCDPERVHQAASLSCLDFAVRGFSDSELLARVERLLGARSKREAVVRSGRLTLDLHGQVARVGDTRLQITPQEFSLLRYLVQNPERPLSRELLVARAWTREYRGGLRTVDIHVRRLRAALGGEATRLETLRQVGYRWRGDATP